MGMNRFAFGRNWQSFLGHLSEQRILAAGRSLRNFFRRDNLHGLRVLDAGCGSGLFSLAALQLGAGEVISFDYDPESVACAQQLCKQYGPYPNWLIRRGSALDHEWLNGLGRFDIVYSWGVLHHTGAMWQALDLISRCVKEDGLLCISLYNDQGAISRCWHAIKHFYNASPVWVRHLMVIGYLAPASLWWITQGVVHLRHPRFWLPSVNERGMHYYYDVVDWLGGYPFETAKPEEVVTFLAQRGFQLTQIKRAKGSGCNEFAFLNRRK